MERRRRMRAIAVMLGVLVVGCGGAATSARETRTEPTVSEAPSPPEETRGEEREEARAAPAPIVPAHGPLAEDDLHHGVLARLRDAPFPACTVEPLPPALRRRVRGGDDLASLRARVSIDVPDDAITTARVDASEGVVYRSAALDPRSDVGDLGYRVRLRDGTSGTEEDLALGLTAMRPLVLVDNPMVRLVDAGEVRIEAELRAIDDASIEFRPADATSTTRDGRERLVRCRLEDLRRDQDADGLTDLTEQRLLTDAWDPDTDGDGTRDGDDVSPLGSAAPSSDADGVWLAAAREIAGDEEGLHVVVRSGARLDLGARGEGAARVLVLREDELAAYQRRYGLRAPVVIAVRMRGRDRAEVTIDRVWSQSLLDARRDASGVWSLVAR
ncbi:hypothetical protein [Sandaracinus amylolyticus]|uniref:hypothetical protein n=1 Tax=Sandaracinus amylolyticus TaxID=927083 RepID=UPI001F32EAC4|nr:hypothetical protein [Sandaracinus amylolyticus]UJR83307.1 Hypothetical protein I5071_53750 [Sandaracinus amylolyticus]